MWLMYVVINLDTKEKVRVCTRCFMICSDHVVCHVVCHVVGSARAITAVHVLIWIMLF